MDILIDVALPLSLATIMFSLGLGLTFGDFTRVVQRWRAFAVGAVSQVLLVPLAAFLILIPFDLPPEIKVGVMLLSFCPGGVTSNILSKLARGDVALSVSLTAVISLLSLVTVPILTTLTLNHFLGDAGPNVSIARLAIGMFLITTLPVLLGVSIRKALPGWARRADPVMGRVAVALFIVIVAAALASNWALFVENFTAMGEALVALNIALLLIGLGLGRAMGLSKQESKTISIETGIQNSTLGITLAGLIAGATTGFSALALPAAVYGITMYAVALPFILWYRRG
ncbi:MAG: bile acid:sodium symporter family protein [Pseudomonadota bacterium]